LEVLNIVQATVNQSHTLMGCIIKQKNHSKTIDFSDKQLRIMTDNTDNDDMIKGDFYRVFIIELTTDNNIIHNLEIERSKQIRIQFLYREKEQHDMDKFLVLIHHECK